MDKGQAIEAYVAGNSFRVVAEKMGVTAATVFRWVKTAGVHRPRKLNRYDIDQAFFDQIDSPDKAYWVGFILADAYVKKTPSGSKIIRFNLSEKDRRQIEKFKQTINYGGPIFSSSKKMKDTGKKYKLVHISVTNAHMFESLEKLGVLDYKHRGVQRVMDSIPVRLIPHVVRGLFDGDGMVYIHRPSRQIGFGFCDEHRANVEWIHHQLIQNLGLKAVKISQSKSKKCHRFQYRGNKQVRMFYDWIYESGPRMERKEAIFKMWFA
jgi:hypothetical protein